MAGRTAGGIASYDNWLSRRRLAVLKRWAAGRSDAGQPVEPPEWHVAKRNYVYRGDVPVQLPARLEGRCAAYTAWRAAEQAVAPRYFAAGGQVIELAGHAAPAVGRAQLQQRRHRTGRRRPR